MDVVGEARGEGRVCTRNFEAGESRGPRDCLGESTHLTGGRIHLDSEERFRKRAVIGERTVLRRGSNIFVTIIGIIVGKGVFKQFSVV